VVVAMQAIHLLNKLGIHPKRTVRFIAWMDEESGASGGQAYAHDHAGELDRHAGAIESDMGAGHPAGIQFADKADMANWLAPVASVLQVSGAGALQKVTDAGTDISFIGEAGVPGFAPAQDGRFYFNYHHTPADTFDKVNPRELSENAAVMTVLGYALADASELAPR
jgi:carboxypeptidase Q